jgi:CDP-paratose 2-epimerase
MTIAIEHPQLDFENNVQGTLNVLQVAHQVGAAIVSCSSIHVYGNNLNAELVRAKGKHQLEHPLGSIDESHPLFDGLVTPLHASKMSAENYVRAYADTYNLPAATFRLTGIYGPRQFGGEDHGWVANFSIKAVTKKPIKIFGTDAQVRDILYVVDAARAFYEWYRNGQPAEAFNIGGGPDCAISIRGVLDKLVEFGYRVEGSVEEKRVGDLWWFISNCNLAYQRFGWKPITIPNVGLRRLVNWIENERSLFE